MIEIIEFSKLDSKARFCLCQYDDIAELELLELLINPEHKIISRNPGSITVRLE